MSHTDDDCQGEWKNDIPGLDDGDSWLWGHGIGMGYNLCITMHLIEKIN